MTDHFNRHALLGAVAVSALLLLAAVPASAQSIKQLEQQIQQLQDSYQSQIQSLQQQVEQLKEQQAQQAEQTEAVRRQAARAAAVVNNGPHAAENKAHQFGLESADGQNSIYLTGRVFFDGGDYFDYNRKSTAAPEKLSDGVNFRSARIGVAGQFLGDWNYGLRYDFGGSSDTFVTGQAGAITSGIENAFITYNGFYKHHQQFPIAFDIGAINVPWTMDQAAGSNGSMFMEYASPEVIATSFGGGDSRTAFGARSNNDRYFLGLYLTGPTTGALHTYGGGTTCTYNGATVSPDNCNGPQMAFLARGTYQVLQNDQGSLHIGVNFGDEFRPRNGSNDAAISLSDFPELRVDPVKFLGTGTIAADSGMVVSAEAAAAWQNAYLQGEFYHYSIDQLAAGVPTLDFDGGYVEGSYSFGGRRHYNPAVGAYSGVIPENPLSFSTGGWGALELAARYSVIDLDTGSSGVACPASGAVSVLRVCGGDQQTFAIGVNYYPNDNIRFMLDLEHANISVPSGSKTASGASFDTIAFRTQVTF